jgi:hypothetical protein
MTRSVCLQPLLTARRPPFKAPHRHNVDGARFSEDFESATAGGCGVSENGPEPSCGAGSFGSSPSIASWNVTHAAFASGASVSTAGDSTPSSSIGTEFARIAAMRRWNADRAGHAIGGALKGRKPCVDSGHATRNRARKPVPRASASPPDRSKKISLCSTSCGTAGCSGWGDAQPVFLDFLQPSSRDIYPPLSGTEGAGPPSMRAPNA